MYISLYMLAPLINFISEPPTNIPKKMVISQHTIPLRRGRLLISCHVMSCEVSDGISSKAYVDLMAQRSYRFQIMPTPTNLCICLE
jgi:hypothetical protein